jgi:hypothetical protein
MVMVPIISKIHANRSKCDNVSFFWFEILHICDTIYEKGIFDQFCFIKKKSLDFQKIENHVANDIFKLVFDLVIC